MMLTRSSHLLSTFRGYAVSAVAAPSQSKAATVSSPVELNSALFDDAKKRVYGAGRSVEKVVITVDNADGTNIECLMNRNVSTPYHCSKHLSSTLAKEVALAYAKYSSGTEEYINLHEPLTLKTYLELVNFNSADHAQAVNEAYWRSCALVLSSTISQGLSSPVKVGSKTNNVQDGFFSVDIEGMKSWEPSKEELASLTTFVHREIVGSALNFETVTLNKEIAAEYGFGDRSILCRLGQYVDVVDGPVISNTQQIGKFSIVKSDSLANKLRFYGVSLPRTQPISSYAWSIIVDHVKNSKAT